MAAVRKAVAYVVVLLALAVGGYFAWLWLLAPAPGGQPAGGPPPGFAMPVEAEPARTDTVVRTLRAVGSLRSGEAVTVASEVAGRVAQLPVAEGQPVRAGQLIVQLDSAIQQAEVKQAQAQLALSEKNFERARELQSRGAGTARTLDEAAAALRTAEAAVALAQTRLEKTRITAPFDGVLGLRRVSIGQYIQPGQEIVNLEQIDPLKVDFRAPETLLTSIRTGQTILVETDALPDRRFEGEVYAIDPLVDPAGRSIVIRARLPNRERMLRPGLFAQVVLVTERIENAVVVPERAVVPSGADQFVYRVVDGKAERVKVAIGVRRDGDVQIASGIRPGDLVVTDGQAKIGPGMPVNPINQGRGAAPGAPQAAAAPGG